MRIRLAGFPHAPPPLAIEYQNMSHHVREVCQHAITIHSLPDLYTTNQHWPQHPLLMSTSFTCSEVRRILTSSTSDDLSWRMPSTTMLNIVSTLSPDLALTSIYLSPCTLAAACNVCVCVCACVAHYVCSWVECECSDKVFYKHWNILQYLLNYPFQICYI